MRTNTPQTASEKLIRVPVCRRGTPVELRVHYEVVRRDGCDSYRILSVDEPNTSTGAH